MTFTENVVVVVKYLPFTSSQALIITIVLGVILLVFSFLAPLAVSLDGRWYFDDWLDALTGLFLPLWAGITVIVWALWFVLLCFGIAVWA